jgi:thioredoxin reductase (NADPH)
MGNEEKNEILYDLVIIGAGPAGLGASIYASRYKLHHVVIGSEIGGQVVEASAIENWAGIESISGHDLMQNFQKHAEKFGAEIVQGTVDGIKKIEGGFEVFCEDAKRCFRGKVILLTLGMKARKLDIPGEDALVGKGVSYCATCDAMFFRNKDVVVVGGGDSAATASLHVSEFANKVYLVYPRDDVRFDPSWSQKIDENAKIEKVKCTKVIEIKGTTAVEGIVCEVDGVQKDISAQGVFIEIGSVPGVALAHELGVEVDEQSYIKVTEDQQTNVENVYAAGDVTTNSNKFRQIITAVAEGSIAAGSIYRKLKLGKK